MNTALIPARSDLADNWRPAFAGAFGGMTPTLLRLATDLTLGRDITATINLSILVGLLLFAILGAGVVWAYSERTLQKAFIIGVSLPSLIVLLASQATRQTPLTKTSSIFEQVVHAYSPTLRNRSVEFYLSPPAPDSAEQLRVLFQPDSSGENVKLARVGQSISVPPDALQVRVSTASAESDWIPLSNTGGGTLVVTLQTDKKRLSGLYYALGLDTPPYQLSVKSKTVISFKLEKVTSEAGCSVVTLDNVTDTTAFLFGLRLTDGHRLNLQLQTTDAIGAGDFVDIFIGPSCLFQANSLRARILSPNELEPAGVLKLMDTAGREVDSRSYGHAKSTGIK